MSKTAPYGAILSPLTMTETPQPNRIPVGDFVLAILVQEVETGRYLSYEGTGFVPTSNVLVTCWHCVARTLSESERYVAARIVNEGYEHKSFESFPLEEITQEQSGNDLAIARISYASPSLKCWGVEILMGQDVWTFGYPFTGPNQLSGEFQFQLRVLKGYVGRLFQHDTRGFGKVDSYEIDMPAPAGLSGAPLFASGSTTLLGVVYGEVESYTLCDWDRIDGSGKMAPESRKVVTFAVSHTIESLRNIRGPATGGRPLYELMEAGEATELRPTSE
jgi:Trypsin-like peptidase domain